MLVVAILLAPLVMLGATLIERRLGPAAGGWATALPISIAIAIVALTLADGSHSAAMLAANAASHVPAQLLFALVFAVALRRWGLTAGVTTGAVAYVIGSLALADLSTVIGLILAAPALILTPRMLPTSTHIERRQRPWHATVLTCASGSLVVAAALITSRAAGPALGGVVAAFPTMSSALTAAVTLQDSRGAGSAVLRGLVRSLPCYFTFALTVSLSIPTLGLLSLLPATGAALAVARLNWRHIVTGSDNSAEHTIRSIRQQPHALTLTD
jgi:hypothetical protein